VALTVFVSHSTQDQDIVGKLDNVIKAEGAIPGVAEFIISPGKFVEEKLRELISKSDVVVAVLTKGGTRSEWVNWELGVAAALEKPIVPLLEEGADIPSYLVGREYIRFAKLTMEDAFDSLAEFIRRLVARKEQIELAILLIAIIAIVAIILLVLFGLSSEA
jgi:nucleoside 2-deoxyribosyltransferase